MIVALILASLTQLPVIVEQPTTVVYEMQTTTYQEYSLVPMAVRTVHTYSLPTAYYRAEPLVPLYFAPVGGKTVIKERGPGFRGKVKVRY
jgi:hypothetical protein